MKTKKELVEEFDKIIKTLIEQKKLKGYPFKRDIKYFDKHLLVEGISLYQKKLENENKKRSYEILS